MKETVKPRTFIQRYTESLDELRTGDEIIAKRRRVNGKPLVATVVAIFCDLAVCVVYGDSRTREKFHALRFSEFVRTKRASLEARRDVIWSAGPEVQDLFYQLLGVSNASYLEYEHDEGTRPPVTIEAMRAMLTEITRCLELIGQAKDLIRGPNETADSIGWGWLLDTAYMPEIVAHLSHAERKTEDMLSSAITSITIKRSEDEKAEKEARR